VGPYWDGGEISDTLDVSMLTKGQMMPEKRRFPVVFSPPGGTHGAGEPSGDDVQDLIPATAGTLGSNSQGGFRTTDLDQMGAFIPMVAHTLLAGGADASEDGRGRGTPLVAMTLSSNGDANSGFRDEGGLVLSGMVVRRLTPRECERLQGFEDGWTAGQSDSARYRQLGNAVCVPVARWIAERIRSA